MLPVRILRPVIASAVLAPFSMAYAASFDLSGANTTAQTLNPTGGTTQAGVIEPNSSLSVSGSGVAVTVTQAAGGTGTATATITNSGTLAQTGTGRGIRNNSGAVAIGVTNNAGATISSVGDDSIQVSVGASTFSLVNNGTISAGTGRAVNLRDAGSNTITISPDHDLVVVWRWHRGNEAEFAKRVVAAIKAERTSAARR